MKAFKKYLKSKGLLSFWFVVVVAAVVVYIVATQAGLALQALDDSNSVGFTVSMTKPTVTKTPAVPTQPVTRY